MGDIYLLIYMIITLITISYALIKSEERIQTLLRLVGFFYLIPFKIIVLFGLIWLFIYLTKYAIFNFLLEKKKKGLEVFPPIKYIGELSFMSLIVLWMLFTWKIVLGIIGLFLFMMLFSFLISNITTSKKYTLWPYVSRYEKERFGTLYFIVVLCLICIVLGAILPTIVFIINHILHL